MGEDSTAPPLSSPALAKARGRGTTRSVVVGACCDLLANVSRGAIMTAAVANPAPAARRTSLAWAARQRVTIALVLLILFGALRYDHFLGAYNVLSVLRYNSMFALTSLGMCFVIMGAGIDLSVGTTAACASVVSALLSPYGVVPGLLGGLGAGLAVGVINGFMVTRMNIQPFIATLSGMLAASGSGLLLAHNQSVSVSYDTDFTWLGQGDLLGFPVPAWIAAAAYVYGSVLLNYTSFGRYVLSIGGNEEAARLMGLPVDRVKFLTYVQSGVFAGLAGVILASQFGAGQPAEGVGWELFSIAAVVVGGTLLTGGVGSVATTLAGVLLLGLIFNVLNFENGLGWISLSAYWQSVVRGVFLMVVVMASSGAARRAIRGA
jgi:galactofuranose transport system permease protein